MVQNTAEATGDLIGDKMPDKITLLGETKKKGKNKQSRRNLHTTRKKAASD